MQLTADQHQEVRVLLREWYTPHYIAAVYCLTKVQIEAIVDEVYKPLLANAWWRK